MGFLWFNARSTRSHCFIVRYKMVFHFRTNLTEKTISDGSRAHERWTNAMLLCSLTYGLAQIIWLIAKLLHSMRHLFSVLRHSSSIFRACLGCIWKQFNAIFIKPSKKLLKNEHEFRPDRIQIKSDKELHARTVFLELIWNSHAWNTARRREMSRHFILCIT